MPPQPQNRHPKQHGEDHRKRHAKHETDTERQLPLHHRDGHAVAAEPVEHRIAERGVTSVAPDDVPTLRQDGEQQSIDAELDQHIRSEPRHRRQNGERHQNERDAQRVHAAFPSRPLGRTINTNTSTPKLATSA